MMMEPLSIALIGVTVLASLGLAAYAGLKAFRGWIDFKRLELASLGSDPEYSNAADLIEIADLKERIRKLEAIAAGIDP
ncbi:hypothetical protein [Sphingomicrobium lutaoense]|uniref:Uncharacterized protein n=1 Tax=Sphingomicrobium lutaoense TaxID=515949 RepID=A0A839Z0T5_9SPHN|nr:hypothetical protein [Sphingomicrobium lutaoense]MBB3763175.1 hypothetical protein [Sphingomicrobium lutaoense]